MPKPRFESVFYPIGAVTRRDDWGFIPENAQRPGKLPAGSTRQKGEAPIQVPCLVYGRLVANIFNPSLFRIPEGF